MTIFSNIYESIISEDKTSIIKNRLVLPDISDNDEKEKFKIVLIDFFKKHPNYENKIDWNKAKTLTRKDFDEVLSLEDSSKSAVKKKEKEDISRDIKNIFKSVGNRKFEIVGENDRWLFVAPLTWEAAVYCDSSENQGAGAKWCIGTNDTRKYWDNYVFGRSVCVMAFNKNYRSLSKEELQNNLKYMIQKDLEGEYHVWNQRDIDKESKLSMVGTERKIADEMFDKAKVALEKEKEKLIEDANKEVGKLLKGVKKINNVTIPEEYRSLITKIEIPDSVTGIGNWAFSGCIGLTLVTIGNGVTDIGSAAFSGCIGLTSVTIPDSVTRIGDFAFDSCNGLTSVTIPDSVTRIGDFAFDSCNGLSSVMIGSGVTGIGDGTFYFCNRLKSVTIPDSVKSIGYYAFYKCPNLTITFQKGFDKSILNKKSFDPSCKFIFEE